ncbi:pericentriolar material 1 protein-like isoform X1 [Lytechinus variegatus]|uniref:pericentriolar material 1 protein-like isoform X1 n=1 Tax=Lytechinus variegatus TaxID=7654 RepID=UPI001BB242CD|nr:pericentriolar material 1 protein-like isoform X1 [Lytechinus variegatus]
MAASRAPPLQRSVMSEPRVNAVPRYNFTQPMDDFLFNLIGGEKEDSKPNNYYNWKPSSTFAEQPSAVVRNKKSKNKEREQNVSGKADAQGAAMMSNGPSRRRTPATYPRTQHVSSVLDREELEHLRQQLTYSDVDDQSTDSQALGSVSIANRVNNARLGDDTSSVESGMRRPPSILDTIFVNEKPDRNKIVARLMQIRDYVKQANAMMSTLQNSMDNPEKDDQVAKLNRLQEHLQEQERGYLALLERMLAEELSLAGSVSGIESSVTSNDLNGMEAAAVNGGRSSQNSGESFATSVAESASINLDARSDISEATTEGTFTARTRPRIESHLGNHSCASDNDISDSELDDIRSVSSQATGSFGMDTQELHEQYSSLLQKYQDGNEENVSAAMERINLSRNEGQDDSKSSQMSSNSSYSLLEGQETKQNVSEQIATLEGLRKQHDLLRKMLKQQEELRTLQNRQAALMTLQSQIESRLTNSEQEKAEETVSVTSTQATTTTATSVTEDPTPVTTTAGPPGRFATGVPLTAEDLQERRRTLMRMLAEQRDTRSEEIQQARAMDWMEQTEVSPPLVSAEHEELRDKLEALQQKKRQMDELLLQLHALHPEMPNIGGDTSSVASTTSNANEYSGLMVPCEEPNETSDENEATLTNGTDSLRKLHDVRERLTELRDLVQQYQDTSQLLGDQDEDLHRKQQMQQLGLGANYEDPVLMSNLRRLERGEPVGRPVQMRPNHMSYGGDGAYVQVGSGQTTSTVTETETETETESNHSSILAAWGDDPEIKEKVRKLQEAKHKLRQLQSLVAMVQQTPEVATALPDDLAELAAGLTAEYSETNNEDEDDEEEDDEGGEEEEEETVEESGSELAMAGATGDHRMPNREEQIPADFARETREAYYEAKMNQQRRELQSLMAERHRLLGVQQQLKELNENLPPVRKPPAKPGMKSVNIIPPTKRDASTNVQSVATPSREEVFSEMRRNKALQSELRQKKNELSDLLHIVKMNRERLREGSDEYSLQTDLAEYDNDLFRELLLDAGRMSMRSADITAAATWGGSTQVSEDEGLEDGYPGDALLQVEEEEEEEQSTVTSDTYTIESGTKPNRRRKVQPYPGVKRVTLEDDGETSSMDAARHGIRYPKNINSATDRQSRLRQENIRSAEELVSDGYEEDPTVQALQGHIQQLQRQLSNSMGMCQSLISDQQSMSNLLSGSLNAGRGGLQAASVGPNPFSPGEAHLDDLVQNYNLRMQHQQLMLNLNSAYNQLYQQQTQIQRLRGQLEERNSEASFDVGAAMAATNTNTNNNAPPMYRNPQRPSGMGYPGQSPPFGRSSGMGPDAMYGPPPYNPAMPFNMNPTFPPGFGQPSPGNYRSPYANPYTPNDLNEGGTGQRDTYNPYARQATQQRLSGAASYHVPPNTAQVSNDDDEFETAYLNSATSGKASRMMGGYTLDSGIGDINDILAREQSESREEITVPPLDITSLLKRTEQQRRLRDELGSQRSNTSSNREGKHPMPSSASQARAQLSSQSNQPSARLAKLLGPKMGTGLSSSISGTAFLDTASIASTVSMSSLPGDMSDKGNNGGRSKGRGQQQQQQVQQDTDRSIRSQTSELESDAGSEFSLFEALRESIYSEVASLISQNETRPHFLIELFRELQMLNSDYLRQRALYALQDLVSKYLTDDNTNASASEAPTLPSERPMPAWMNFAGSEQTPSESFITSDEEEIKARLFGANLQKPHESSYALLEDDQYDYIENVDSASSLSTPPSLGRGEFGFANEDLGDTVIHLDKALKRMREYERLKAEAEAASGISSIDNAKERSTMSASDMTSNSSAQDMGSESSFSDLPYPRIDTRQLDLQIKGIMQEVIPYLKEHMDDVCSPQLLAYIRRLVLGLARQKDESREFVRFFNRQLGSILEDSLAKFSGRKMRECGEDLLVDISEILFNELAFFRLMQDLDTAGNKLKQEAAKRDDDDDDEDDDDEDDEEEEQTETGTETGTAQDQVTGEGESSSDESSSDEDDTVQQRHPQGRQQQDDRSGGGVMEQALETAMAVASRYEEEELGNMRDDMLATQVDISDREEDSEPQSVDHLQIELSMSESKGVTYIGSGEEEDDSDHLGEAVEETITRIGAANADGEVDSVDDTTMSTEIPVESDASQKENISRQESLEKDPAPAPAPASEPKETTDDSTPQDTSQATVGENNNEEITLDDLPSKLTVITQNTLESQMTKEQTNTDGVQGVLETMVDGEAQLAGDPMALRAPEGAPVENGIIEGNPGEIGSE